MDLPETIKVRTRSEGVDNTPLGYVTYVDLTTKKLRKQESWSKWGSDYLGEFSNAPKAGFKLETTVKRSSEWFGSGRTMFRIQHPDNFLFEITSDNFSEIARSSSIIKGEITCPCILAWQGASLSLIPTDSDLYQEQLKLKAVVDAGDVRDYVIGRPYKDKNGNIVGYYGGSYIVANIKSKYDRGYLSNNYEVNITFSMVSVFYSYQVLQGHGYFHDAKGSYVPDNNPTHNSYTYNSWTDPKVFECSNEEFTNYQQYHVFDIDAPCNIDSFNEHYIGYRDSRLIPNTADEAYFETLAKSRISNNINLTIKYNKISDRYLNFHNQKQGA